MKKKTKVRTRVRRSKNGDNTKTRDRLSDAIEVPANAENVKDKSRDGKASPTLDEAKLRALFLLLLQGKTQKDCAHHFNVTDRTIRNWAKRFDDLRPDIIQALDPEKEMVRALYRFAARETELLKWKNAAENDGDARTKVSCNKELRQLERERQAFLEKIGLFSNYRPQFNFAKDPAAEEVDYIAGITAGLLQFSDLESDQNDLDEEP